MLNPFHEVNWRPGPAERRRFAASLIVGFPLVATGLLLAGRWHSGGWNLFLAATVGGIGTSVGLVLRWFPAIARPCYVLWYAIACAGGFVVGNLLLAGIYYLLFTPIGWARRALGRRTLQKGFDRGASTYWREAPPPGPPESYYRQF